MSTPNTSIAGERTQLDGEFQYRTVVRKHDGSPASATEYSDWFTDDDAAKRGLLEIMEAQGYNVASVDIGFPISVVTLEAAH